MTNLALHWTRETVERLSNDPALSYWARQALIDLARRDPLDALQDCERLTALMRDRFETALRQASTAPQWRPDDPSGSGPCPKEDR